MTPEVIDGLKAKFGHVHPLIFHRSVEKAKTVGELFDILSDIPPYPIVWSEEDKKWVETKDLFQARNFKIEE